jgi:hypothetical protein
MSLKDGPLVLYDGGTNMNDDDGDDADDDDVDDDDVGKNDDDGDDAGAVENGDDDGAAVDGAAGLGNGLKPPNENAGVRFCSGTR